MGNSVIVLVSDLDNAIHGEINVLKNADEATRLVESLIESGFEQERIRVFLGDELQMEVRHRPVVSLSTDTEAQATNEVSETVGAPSTVAPAVKHENSGATRAASVVLDNISAEPYARNGQRFSAQFGPDVLSPA